MPVSESAPYILSIDQGTTSSRAVAFDLNCQPVASAQEPFKQIYPRDGWVEHNPEDIWRTVSATMDRVISEVGGLDRIAAIGITNQRETTVLWDRVTGAPVYNAIVWQDRRGAEICRDIANSDYGDIIQQKTGLIPDSYFSATKLQWLLDSDDTLRRRAQNGDLAFGTIDTFLMWRLSGGAVHATDATNASRTMLFNIHDQSWDDELLHQFNVPERVLPRVHDTAHAYGVTNSDVVGAKIPITAMVGDQQGALAGQNCFSPGMAKCTFGTGAFVLLNTGGEPPVSNNRLLATVGYRLHGQPAYALEGSVFNAGTVVQWLRDGLGLVDAASETEALAEASTSSGVTFVPAFTGLGAPHWDPSARGAILGLTRDTSKADIVRAGIEAVCFQTLDLLDAMTADTGKPLDVLRVDGGMAANSWMLQTLADMAGVPVERPAYLETTVQGAALLAGYGAGLFASLDDAAELQRVDHVFEPTKNEGWRQSHQARWKEAVRRISSDP